jgi:hypothetical protein
MTSIENDDGPLLKYADVPAILVIAFFAVLLIPSVARNLYVLEPFAIWLLPHVPDNLVAYAIVPWYMLLATIWAVFLHFPAKASGGVASFVRFWKVFVILYAIATLPVAAIGRYPMLGHNSMLIALAVKLLQVIAIILIIRTMYGLRLWNALMACLIGCVLQGTLMGSIYFVNGRYLMAHWNEYMAFAQAHAMNARITPH